MTWNTQTRVLEVVSDAIPEHYGKKIFEVQRCKGVDKLGRLFDYQIDVRTIEANGLYVQDMEKLVDVNKMVGRKLTVCIAMEGNGTSADGEVNVGAGVREITGVISRFECMGADDRRMYYRIRLRCLLWLATQNRNSQKFLDMDVCEISSAILKKYPMQVRWDKVIGAGDGERRYPKRDYQRQFWESDWEFLNRIWQEWGLSFYWESGTLVMIDNHAYPGQDPAYKTVRYMERGGQRIDEEHIHKLKYSRKLTTGAAEVVDYDYTIGDDDQFGTRVSRPSDAANDNAVEYTWADFAQPLQGEMGLNAQRNDHEFEGSHLARVRADAHRSKSLVITAKGNLRGVATGRQIIITEHPFRPVNRKYVVTGTKIDFTNNASVTQGGEQQREYACRTEFTAIPSPYYYRIPLKAKKPRAFAETAIVTGYERHSGVLTDAMGRVRVKFSWDQWSKRDEDASCWVPLMQVWQGTRYGGMWIPRVGDHVYVGYINMDPDRPFILGSHTTNDNMVPWDLYRNHALAGWRSQDLSGPMKGANAVMTDDTPDQLQVQVTSDHANSRFVAGYNVRIDGDYGRAQARGVGIEIATDANAVMRAPGMLITTEARKGATAPMKDMGETVARLTAARELQESLLQQAQYQDAQQAGTDQAEISEALKAQNNAIKGGARTSSNKFPELSEPQLVLASAASTALTAEQSTHIASNEHLALTTGLSVGIAAGKSLLASVQERFSVFVQRMGITMIAAAGRILFQSKTDGMSLLAQKMIEIVSAQGVINIKTPNEITLNAGGTQLTLNASGAFIHTDGQCLIHCADFDTPGPESKPLEMPKKPHDEQFTLVNKATGKPLVNMKYKVVKETGEEIEGITDAEGKTMRVITHGAEQLMIHLIH
ncbi:type VI secretion system Vgr family protein [Paraburkholderia sp. J67]|uniref:type VI secretion system Vgr family protein n=1 Tax=Paraburkholderia sp. J67 TaxID=2805435 RepID=UPI002ABE8A76|nr:type VI secretion system tip protein TssI/VgrG [Paraburkholderia sp. J67]